MIRQQTSEARDHVVFITDDDGVPLTGLTPTALAWRIGDGASLTAPTVSEIGGGFYKVATGALAASAVIRVDRGTTGTARYIVLEAVVGGYVDSIDATVSSRATAAALATAQADITTLLGRLTSTRAALLDSLSNLDATISSRASSAAVAGVQSDTDALQLDTASLLGRLTSTRASLLDALSLLDVAVSTRATPDDLDVTVSGSTTAHADIS